MESLEVSKLMIRKQSNLENRKLILLEELNCLFWKEVTTGTSNNPLRSLIVPAFAISKAKVVKYKEKSLYELVKPRNSETKSLCRDIRGKIVFTNRWRVNRLVELLLLRM